ncbi:NUDIX hydrolase [Salipiger sp. H15]|uniref:NUDIX hydrolase n=1 Tax=Alloyangia sp. H15 TaxID=3029062 RepID=A0AAU8AKU0_9RHOB
MLRSIWQKYIGPAFLRPPRFQVAALCHRQNPQTNELEVLLITSRETKRWVLPKGWPKRGYDAAGTAVEEAWEEAGVRAPSEPPLKVGSYRYEKRLDGGLPAPTHVDVYAVEAKGMFDTFPEAGERERRWVRPAEAATMVEEPSLRQLLARAPDLLVALASG